MCPFRDRVVWGETKDAFGEVKGKRMKCSCLKIRTRYHQHARVEITGHEEMERASQTDTLKSMVQDNPSFETLTTDKHGHRVMKINKVNEYRQNSGMPT